MERWWPTLAWVVPPGEAADYEMYGAAEVYEVGPSRPGGRSLIAARNYALDLAFAEDRPCLMLDDDLKSLAFKEGDKPRPMTLEAAVSTMDAACASTGAMLAGASPTPNAYFAQRPISTRHFVIASLMYVLPTPLRFDDGFELKEDYDYTCQHLAEYGAVARCDYILPGFDHYSNRGGCQDYRTMEREKAAVARLKEKWPGVFRDNPRRDGEVLLKWPTGQKGATP